MKNNTLSLTNNILTLSDKIIATATFSDFLKEFYNTYTIYIDNVNIYTGRIFVHNTGNGQTKECTAEVYLNDILNKLFFNHLTDKLSTNYNGKYVNHINVRFDSYTTSSGTAPAQDVEFDVCPMYESTFGEDYIYQYAVSPIQSICGGGISGTDISYDLIPRIPFNFIADGYSIFMVAPQGYSGNLVWRAKLDDDDQFGVGRTDSITVNSNDLFTINIPNDYLSHEDLIGKDYIVTGRFSSANRTQVDLCHVDACPAKYYLLWYDRFGGRQCQPFNKKHTETSSYTVTNKINRFNEESPLRIKVEDTISINTGWVNEEALKCYESVFVSPIVMLYDSERDKMLKVSITDKSFTYKTLKNERKFFNFALKLKVSEKQNIIY